MAEPRTRDTKQVSSLRSLARSLELQVERDERGGR